MAETCRHGQPSEPAADPGGGLQRQGPRERAEEQVEAAVGGGCFQEEVAGAPGRVGGVAGLREVDRLVDVGNRPGRESGEPGREPGDEEEAEDAGHGRSGWHGGMLGLRFNRPIGFRRVRFGLG